jgi:hypothetical protein
MMVVPLSAYRDRGPLRAAQGTCARALLGAFPILCGALLACGANRVPPAAAPNDAPARDVIVRTSRFAIHANGYVDFYADAFATLPAESSGAGAALLLDAPLVAKLGACSDDPCARSALVGTGFGGLDDFLRTTWAAHESDARRMLGSHGTSLMDLEDVLAPTLARQIGKVWPDDPIVVFVAHAGGRLDSNGGRDGAVIDAGGECFGGDALLECLFTRALEVLLPESDLGRALEEEGTRRGDVSRAASAGFVACVAALATDAAVAATEARYTPTRRFVTVCSEPARAWLEGEWPKRMHGDESAKAFAVRLVEEGVRAKW